jgi:hypothetical protein
MAKKAFYKTEKFKKLEADWYQKLKSEGFEDIEDGNNSEVIEPQVFQTRPIQHLSGDTWAQECVAILKSYPFRKDLHRKIFELHAQGNSVRDIVRMLKMNFKVKVSVMGVNLIINRVRANFRGEI